MKKTLILLILGITLTGCSIISANYVASSDIHRQSTSSDTIQVYYHKEDVPFAYKELGRVFVQNLNYWADRDPAGQVLKIKKEAAAHGADAVIIMKEMRKESSFTATDHTARGNAGDVFQYHGIAIIQKLNTDASAQNEKNAKRL